MEFESTMKSDTAPLNHMVRGMLSASESIHVLRDPTRGGLGTALNEIAEQSHAGMMIYEDRVPIRREVAGVCELLGFDPLYVANEGKLIAIVPDVHVNHVLEKMKETVPGKEACVIGEVIESKTSQVLMKTRIGGTRIIQMLTGEQLPRIC